MIIKKDNSKIHYLYHYTPKENVESILSSGVIQSEDQYTFFTDNYYKSINLFENEMMSNKYHITKERIFERRSYANPEDYRIIKIPYYNDGNFVKMIFDNQPKVNIYNVSTIHKGNLYFEKEKAEVLEIPVQKGNLFLPKLFAKLSFFMMIFFNPILTKADTYLDNPSYYNTEWFDPNTYNDTQEYTITTAKELAGLSYLANREGYTFEGKKIIFEFPKISSSIGRLEAVDHDWVQLPATFAGDFENRIFDNYGISCGYHLLVIGTEAEGQVGIKEGNQCNVYYDQYSQGIDSVIVRDCKSLNSTTPGYYRIIPEAENGTISLKRKASIGDKNVTFTITPDYGYVLENYSVIDKSNNTVNVTQNNDKYSFTMPRKEVTIHANFKKALFTIQINSNNATIEPAGPLEVEYLENQSFRIKADVGYECKGYQINDGEMIPINSSEFVITVDQNMTINVVVEPIDYTLTDQSKENKYIFNVEEEFDTITEVNLCKDNSCTKLKQSEYEVKEQNIILLNEIQEGNYTLQVSFSNHKTSTIDFKVKKKIVNPETKRNLLLIVMIPILFLTAFITRRKGSKRSE